MKFSYTFAKHLEKLKIETPIYKLFKVISLTSFLISLFASLYIVAIYPFSTQFLVVQLFISFFILFPLLTLLLFFGYVVYIDFLLISRTEQIEKFFPEYIHLVATNIRAGMTLDQSLWGAIRPRFGALSEEMELVAKRTMMGEELVHSLQSFSHKYDSKIIARSISLIIEGVAAGSEMGDLLENIALGIEDIQLRKESMAANVTSNSIFITFAVLFASPLLYAVAYQLLHIIKNIGGRLNDSTQGSVSITVDAVSSTDFFIFCMMGLIATSFMSALIVSAIKTGTMADAVKKLPLFIGVPLVLFFVGQYFLGNIFSTLL